MSITLMAAAWKIDGGPTEKLVLLALADRANDEGRDCWPSIKTLCTKTGLSERGLQMAIKRLVEREHLTRQVVTGKGVNYHVHPRTSCAPADNSPPHVMRETPAPRAPNTSRTTIKNNKATPYRSNASDAFDAFWQAYPRRTAKLAAQKAFASAIKRGADPNAMTAAAQSFADSPDRDPQFTPHPATWLNQGRYDDQPQEICNGRTRKPERNKVTDNPMVLAFARMAGHIDADGNPTPGARRCDATGSPPSAREHSRPAFVALPSIKHH